MSTQPETIVVFSASAEKEILRAVWDVQNALRDLSSECVEMPPIELRQRLMKSVEILSDIEGWFHEGIYTQAFPPKETEQS